MAVIVATRANYWISSTALSITLNALGEPNRIQASVASGAVIMCYIRGVEGLDFDNGHNYRRWPLTISPTYFNSNTEKYLYVAIPRSNTIGSDAMVVFPSQKLDIYGYAVVENPETHEQTQGEQIGTDDYYYIWLQGIITSSGESGTTPRDWSQRPDYGILRTDEATDSTETNWYRWDPITQTVTFLKDIWMDATSVFKNLRLTKMIFNGHELNGVAVKDVTPSDSDDTIVTPAYLDGFTDGKYIRKDQDDRTDFSLGVGGNLTVDGDATVDGTLFANQSVRTDEVRSSNYTGDTIADTGYLLTAGLTNGLGHSKLTIDEIYVRMKATFESLEVRKWSVVAGDEIRSCAANVINRVDYFTDTGELLGYTEKRVPWLMKRVPFLLKLFGNVQSQWGRYLYSKIVRMRVTLSNADVARIAYCRCYFLADDGDTTIENWWQRDDLVRCQTMNITSTIRNTYTNIQRKAGNVFWWRKCIRVSANGVAPSENPDNVRCQPAIIDEKTYHWFDVVFNGAIEYDPTTGQMTGRTDGNFMVNSDLPAAGDHAIQFGNTTIPGRMNLWITMVNGGSTRDYDPDGDAPCIKGFTGIYTFDLSKCFTGGNPCKMTLAPGKKYHFYGREFRVIKEYGEVPMPTQRGVWLELPLELDEENNQLTYPDDIYNDQGAFVSRGGYILVNGVKRYGSAENPIPRTYARKCYWYDEVTHKGGTWLCSITEGSHWVADVAFTDDATGRSFTAGQLVPAGIYSALSTLSKAKCSSHEDYTTDEPSGISASWTGLTRGVTTMETRYRKKARLKYNSTLQKYEVDPDAGIIPPAEPWAQWYTLQQWEAIQRSGTEPSPENQIMQDGDYMWSCTMTEFSSDNPVFEYKVVRWGIDSDGLKMNSYFLGLSNTSIIITPSNDNYKMPGDSGWDAAAPQGKWWDTFDAMAAANGGVGAMQGWNVWTKTVVHYDLAENKSPDEQKPDLVQYTCSRIGQDGQIAQEEYYMLAESDDFATVFGNPAQAASYYYAKTGIRWYTEDTPSTTDLPEAERYRLSQNTPNICTSAAQQTTEATPIWSPTRPSYDNSTAAKAAKKFLWNFEQRADGQGTEYASRPICIGDHSRGIKGVLELYALSASGTPQSGHHIPDDIWAANNNSETDYSKSDPTKPKTWTDELADRAPTEELPYQWNWTRTLYTTPLNAADTQKDPTTGWWYEDHWHVSAVRGTKGEDGAGTEYVYCRPQSHNADGTPLTVTLPDPNILKDKDGVARTAAYIKQTDDFIPYEYTDNPVGIDFQHQIEYQCERKSTATTGTGGFTGGHEWGAFSSPKLWSKWGKNGMDGDGVEYVFIRTTKNVAPVLSSATATDSKGRSATDAEYLPLISNISACGAETNGKAGECTDDPKGCTRDWPYEWVAKRTMASPNAESGQRVWKTYYASVDSPYKMSPWSNYAENSMRLDLSNEMDMVQTDSTGKILAARTVETLVHFYDGAKEITLGNNDLTVTGGPDVTSANKIATFSNTASGNARKLSWAFIAGKTMAAAYNITVSFTYLGVTHTVTFTIAASMGQPIYQLQPTLNSISFSRKTDNTLDPASRQLGLKILKIDGNSTTELASAPSGYSVRYSTASMPASKTAGTAWGTSDGTTGISWSGSVMTIASSVTIGDVFIALFFGDVIIDRETIPVLKDGMHGSNAVRLDLDNENDSMLYTGGGTLVSGNVTSTAYLFDGPEDKSAQTTFSIIDRVGVTSSQATISGRVITVTGMNATTAKVTVQGVYTDGHNQTHTKTAVLSLKKIVDGDKYDLVITPNAIAYNSSTDSPAASTIAIQVWKMSVNSSGGSTRALSAPPSGYAVYANGTALTASSTGNYSYQTDNSAINEVLVKIATSASSTDVLDAETVPINKAKDGTSPWIADLDNEMDSVACDVNGHPTASTDVYTNLSFFYGSSRKSFKITGVTINGSASKTGVTLTYSTSADTAITFKATYATSATISGKDDIAITLRPEDATSETRTLHFTINGIRPGTNGQPATLYRLVPSCSEVVKKKDGSYSVANVSCTRQKNVGGTITDNTTDGTIECYLDGIKKSSYTNNENVATTSFSTSIKFVFKVNNVVVDQETIPLVTDGTDGRGITNVNTYFKAAASQPSTPTGAPASSGWADDGTTLITKANADAGYHLYESTCTTYTNGTYSWTTPLDDGLIADMASTSEEFALSNSGTTAPTTGWSTTVSPQKGKWIWSRTVLTFKNGDKKYVSVQCVGYCGTDGTTPTISIGDNKHWIINGVDSGIVAEGKDGTGVEIKGEVATTSAMESSGYVTPVGGSRVKADKGDCYICDANRHLYMWDGAVWVDLGEFQGEPGKNSYMHIAYATSITFSGSTVSAVTGFTVDNAGIDYDWWGFCTDNSETDPGRGASSTDVTAARKYKWNYMKGKDGNGTEYIYLLTKEDFTPTINQSSGQGTPSADEFRPAVANYTAGKIYGNSQYWYDDPPTSVSETWPVLWWAKREYTYKSATGKSSWDNFGAVTLHNRYSKDGDNGNGYALVLVRNNKYTDAQWNAYAVVGSTEPENWGRQSGEPDFTVCRVGDLFIISGSSSDTHRMHTATFKCTSVSSNSINGLCISHIVDGDEGPKGETGRMFYLAGVWKNNVTYSRNDKVCPIVEYNDNYWYLDADSSYNNTPSVSSSYWKLAENFGVVLTEALFTQFAKLGGFIVAGDFFISQFGELFASDDYTDVNSKSLAAEPVMSDGDGSIIEDESGMVPYMYFYSSDPSVMNGQNGLEDNELRFRPTLCINSVTGAMFMARGNVVVKPDGEVVLKNTLFASSIQSNALDTQSVNKRRIHIEGGRMEVYNDAGQVGLSLGWDANGDPYLQVAKVGSDGTVSKAYKLTYDGVSQASASMTSDIFTSRQLNRAGGSAKTIYNNTSASYYYNYSAARNTVTGVYSTENPSGGAASTLYQTYRSQQDGRWFTTNTKTYVISSSGSEYRIPDGYYIAASGGYNSSTGVYSRALYNANEGIIAQVGTVYFMNPTSGVGLWCDADGSNGKQAFDVSRYLSQRDRLD